MKNTPLARSVAAVVALSCAAVAPVALAAVPTDLLVAYTRQAGAPAVPARGQQLFTTAQGRNGVAPRAMAPCRRRPASMRRTGKPIAALAPAFNAQRFTDAAKSEKWFRRNCNDVIGRECSAGEKADVLAWLLTLKP